MISSFEAYEGGTDSVHPCFPNVGESGRVGPTEEGDEGILVPGGTPGTVEGGRGNPPAGGTDASAFPNVGESGRVGPGGGGDGGIPVPGRTPGTDTANFGFPDVGKSGRGLSGRGLSNEAGGILLPAGTAGTDGGGVVLGLAFCFVFNDLILIFFLRSFATAIIPRRTKGSPLIVALFSRCPCAEEIYPPSQKGTGMQRPP